MNIRTLIVFLWVASALSGVMAGDEPVRLEWNASQVGTTISPLPSPLCGSLFDILPFCSVPV